MCAVMGAALRASRFEIRVRDVSGGSARTPFAC